MVSQKESSGAYGLPLLLGLQVSSELSTLSRSSDNPETERTCRRMSLRVGKIALLFLLTDRGDFMTNRHKCCAFPAGNGICGYRCVRIKYT